MHPIGYSSESMRKAIAFCFLAAALSQAEDQRSRLNEIIESYVNDHRFMGSVLVAKGGEILLIHELLHSLGLGENPPTSAQITNTVMARCGI